MFNSWLTLKESDKCVDYVWNLSAFVHVFFLAQTRVGAANKVCLLILNSAKVELGLLRTEIEQEQEQEQQQQQQENCDIIDINSDNNCGIVTAASTNNNNSNTSTANHQHKNSKAGDTKNQESSNKTTRTQNC